MNAKCPTNDRNHKPLSKWRIKAGGLLIFTLGIHMVTNPNRVLNFGETSKYDSLIWLGNTLNRTLGTKIVHICGPRDQGKATWPGHASMETGTPRGERKPVLPFVSPRDNS